jgi:hypothetical protein
VGPLSTLPTSEIQALPVDLENANHLHSTLKSCRVDELVTPTQCVNIPIVCREEFPGRARSHFRSKVAGSVPQTQRVNLPVDGEVAHHFHAEFGGHEGRRVDHHHAQLQPDFDRNSISDQDRTCPDILHSLRGRYGFICYLRHRTMLCYALSLGQILVLSGIKLVQSQG